MFNISIADIDNVLAWVAGLPNALNNSLLKKSQDLAGDLQSLVEDKLSGEVLHVRTGALRDSVTCSVSQDNSGVTASVSAGSDVPYAAIQEYGGQTKAHIIEATNGKALAFNFQGKQTFFAHVNHPGSNIPARSYLRSSLDDMSDNITGGYADAASELNS